jgi:restriction system protein
MWPISGSIPEGPSRIGGRLSGVVSAWADAQRRRQREIEAQQRAWQAAQDEQARDHREALRAYQQGRDADAAARTGELDARAAGLGRRSSSAS